MHAAVVFFAADAVIQFEPQRHRQKHRQENQEKQRPCARLRCGQPAKPGGNGRKHRQIRHCKYEQPQRIAQPFDDKLCERDDLQDVYKRQTKGCNESAVCFLIRTHKQSFYIP